MPPHTCRDCLKTWGGVNTAHCSGCHQTFTGIKAFDLHRKNYQCLRPENVGLTLVDRKYPCWGVKYSEEDHEEHGPA